jgi:hypothetical protein
LVQPCDELNFLFVEDPDDDELDIMLDGYSGGDAYLFGK